MVVNVPSVNCCFPVCLKGNVITLFPQITPPFSIWSDFKGGFIQLAIAAVNYLGNQRTKGVLPTADDSSHQLILFQIRENMFAVKSINTLFKNLLSFLSECRSNCLL